MCLMYHWACEQSAAGPIRGRREQRKELSFLLQVVVITLQIRLLLYEVYRKKEKIDYIVEKPSHIRFE